MSDSIIYDFKGLVTAPGNIATAVGSCSTAANLVFEAPGLVRLRKGFARNANTFGGPIWKIYNSRLLASNFLVNTGTSSVANALKYGDGTAAATNATMVGASTLTNQPSTRMMCAESQKNVYITSDEGVRRLETDFTAHFAGLPMDLGSAASATLGATLTYLTGAPGTLLADGQGVAYRSVWVRNDKQGVEMVGAPTARQIIRNSAGTPGYVGATVRDAVPSVALPAAPGTASTAIDTFSYTLRTYRTKTFTLSSGPPDEEYFLVHEVAITAGASAIGYINFTDNTPDTLLGPPLYTNPLSGDVGPNGERGIASVANNPPYVAKDVAQWSNCLWYANCGSQEQLVVTMLSLPADAENIVIGTRTYTFKDLPAVAPQTQIWRAGGTYDYGSTSLNIEATCISLCATINCDPGNTTHYAFYISGPAEGASLASLPGQILLTSRLRANPGFSFTPSAASKWRGPTNYSEPSTGGAGATVTNLLFFSKPYQADAVPPTNRMQVGPAGATILRVVPYRDRLLIFTDYGIYQVSGTTSGNFALAEFDLTYHLIARECVATCDDRVYAWCSEGIIEISDGGVKVVSTPIEPTVREIVQVTVGRTAMASYAFAVAYQTQHKVLFFYPQDGTTTNNKQSNFWLTFDTRTRCWSGTNYFNFTNADFYRDGRSCGALRLVDDVILLGSWNKASSDAWLWVERNAGVAADYQDDFSDGTTGLVRGNFTLSAQFPAVGSAMHWQEVQVDWEDEDVWGYANPTTSLMGFTNTNSGNPSYQTLAVSGSITRVMVPRANRRSDRLVVALSNSNTAAGTAWGFQGLVIRFLPGTRLTVNT